MQNVVKDGFKSRTAPQELVAQLQEIDPNADLLYLGAGEWMLGVRKENNAAGAKVQRLLGAALERDTLTDPVAAAEQAKRIELLQIMFHEGFKPVAIYDGLAGVVEDFRERDFRYRNMLNDTFAMREREAVLMDRTEATEAMEKDYIDTEGRFIYRHFFRRAKRFVQRKSLFN